MSSSSSRSKYLKVNKSKDSWIVYKHKNINSVRCDSTRCTLIVKDQIRGIDYVNIITCCKDEEELCYNSLFKYFESLK